MGPYYIQIKNQKSLQWPAKLIPPAKSKNAFL